MEKHPSSLLFIFFSTHLTLIFFDLKFHLTLNTKTKCCCFFFFINAPPYLTYIRLSYYNDTNSNSHVLRSYAIFNDNDAYADTPSLAFYGFFFTFILRDETYRIQNLNAYELGKRDKIRTNTKNTRESDRRHKRVFVTIVYYMAQKRTYIYIFKNVSYF